MKVTGQDPAKTAELNLTKGKGKDKAQPGGEKRRSRESALAPTRASLTMDKVKEAIRKEPDVRAERVAELKEKVESGKYQIDADKLAENVLTDSLREDLEKP